MAKDHQRNMAKTAASISEILDSTPTYYLEAPDDRSRMVSVPPEQALKGAYVDTKDLRDVLEEYDRRQKEKIRMLRDEVVALRHKISNLYEEVVSTHDQNPRSMSLLTVWTTGRDPGNIANQIAHTPKHATALSPNDAYIGKLPRDKVFRVTIAVAEEVPPTGNT